MAATDYTIILKHLEKLESKMDGLSNALQETNISITKLEGMKHALHDLKTWKENVESVVNPEDLREMKKSLQDIKEATKDMEQVEEDIASLQKEKKADRKEIDKLKTFKTKAMTMGAILFVLFSTALTVLGWYLA